MKFPAPLAQVQAAGLLDVGVVIHFANGEKLLIGNVNEQLGWCGCTVEDYTSPVVQLERVWAEGAVDKRIVALRANIKRLEVLCETQPLRNLRKFINSKKEVKRLLLAANPKRGGREGTILSFYVRDEEDLGTIAVRFGISPTRTSQLAWRAFRRVIALMPKLVEKEARSEENTIPV